jgi:hypothetical protein
MDLSRFFYTSVDFYAALVQRAVKVPKNVLGVIRNVPIEFPYLSELSF